MTETLYTRTGLNARQLAAYSLIKEAWQKPVEFEGLLSLLLEEPPGLVIEVGAGRGGSFWAFSQVAAPDALMVSVDQGEVDGAYCASVEMLQGYTAPGQTAMVLRGDSQDAVTAEALKDALGGHLADFLFLDADHREFAVRRDHALYSPFVKPGGLIGLHDIIPVKVNRWTPEYAVEVAPLWNDIKAEGVQAWEFIQEDDLTWGGIGVYEQPEHPLPPEVSAK